MKTSWKNIFLSLGFIAVSIWIFLNLYNGVLGIGEKGDTVVPDVTGKTVREAKSILEKDGLTFAVARSDYSEKIPKDTIISQNPDAGMSVKKERPIQVVVSAGVQTAQVPDLRGLDLREAVLQLENSRLISGNVQYINHPVAKRNVVVAQTPLPGKEIPYESAVNLTVSMGPPPKITMPRLTGYSFSQAKTALQDAKLLIGQVAWKLDSSHPPGDVLTQNPAAGTKVHEMDMVSLVVSAGEKAGTPAFKQSYITIDLPQFDGEKEVSVWVTDDVSTNLAYRGLHHGGEKIELMVSGYGSSKVDVYLGSQLLSSGQL